MVDNSELAGKKRGVYTLPPYAGWTNQQLTKNCGIVPYLLMKRYGFHAVMAGAKIVGSRSFRFFEVYIVVSLIYWLVCIVIEQLLNIVERRMRRFEKDSI